ncbi:hypothetical protein XF24_00186 [candidate division SR1 bacterium Aalborg_AAW-1]|nr:hypothetical protein XF24_00186 [candidate division SR1 bacterium Aalborg_AAW-1]
MISYVISKEQINILWYLIDPIGLIISIILGVSFLLIEWGGSDAIVVNFKISIYMMFLMYGAYLICYGVLGFLIFDLPIILKSRYTFHQKIIFSFRFIK